MPPYATGSTPFITCQADQRVSYCLYVPARFARLCVYVHGTDREAAAARDALRDFAEARQCLVLAPLFPAGILAPADVDNYKGIAYHGLRFDTLLLAMIDEVAARYDVDAARFLLCGFSGGAQFVHRFYYLHPRRLAALSIAAPGKVTLPDAAHTWPIGVADLEARFGASLNVDSLRAVPVHLVVGSADADESDTRITATSRYWRPDANLAGVTRVERLQTLSRHLTALGVATTFELVPNAGHELAPLLARSVAFFAHLLHSR